MNEPKKETYSGAGIASNDRLRLDWKDIVAIIIAVYKVFFPLALMVAGAYALLLLIIDLLY